MNLIEVFILALIQGITEWLPVSSSGHLALAQLFLGVSAPVLFDIILHLGTLFVILVAFRRDIANILTAFARRDFKTEEGRIGLYVILGSVPTAVIGFVLGDTFEAFFSSSVAIALALVINGFVLYASKLPKKKGRFLNWLDALLIGTAQGVALIPGISRSGATISTGLLRRVKIEQAFRYSFLLFIPAVIGASLVDGLREWQTLSASDIDFAAIALGLFVTSLVGYAFLWLLRKVVLREKFHWFSYYCWALGFLILLVQFF